VSSIDDAGCDIRYVINGFKYGLRIGDVEAQLASGKNVAVILSDFRVIRRLKERFGANAVALYVSSEIDPAKLLKIHGQRHQFSPSADQKSSLYKQFSRLKSAAELQTWNRVFEFASDFVEAWRDYIPDSKSAQIRAQKIRTFHDRYIENIALFDHVVLNYREPGDMLTQYRSLVGYYRFASPSGISLPVFFVVAASSGAGKGVMMEALRKIGSDRVAVVPKMARREPKEGDAEDGMIPIGSSPFPDEFDFRWSFHKGKESSGTEYGISSSAVKDNLARGRHQIVVSNMGQFDNFRQRYGDRVVFIYLHRVQTQEAMEDREYKRCKTREEARDRIAEVRTVHEEYLTRIAEFRHVLLNTTDYAEDLFDQMFRLIEHYDSELLRHAVTR
jgi:ribose 1,5-bisphosphokinase PhnN